MKGFKKGDRVRLSQEGSVLQGRGRWSRRVIATVASDQRTAWVRLIWDGRKTSESYYEGFFELASTVNRDDRIEAQEPQEPQQQE